MAATVSPIASDAERARASQPPISPLVGEMTGRPEGGNVEHYCLHDVETEK
jgi:hypothetical protein